MVAPMDPGTAEVGDMTTVDGGTLESDNRGGARGGGEGLAEGVWGSFIGVSGGDWRVKERRGWFVWGSEAPRGSGVSKEANDVSNRRDKWPRCRTSAPDMIMMMDAKRASERESVWMRDS
eukprot:441039-Rhodomonas_salina.1